jgi:DNA mismatch repair protein MutS2
VNDAEPKPLARLLTRAKSDLEYDLVLERIARRCAGEAARARLAGRQPLATLEEARSALSLSAEAIALEQEGAPLVGAAVDDIAPALARVRRGASASSAELCAIRDVLRAAATLRRFIGARRQSHPALAERLDSDARLDALRDELGAALEPDGSVADAASPELRAARRRVNDARRELLARLAALMNRHKDVLRDEYYAERDGRYVLPVRADAHYRLPGIVLGSSASGATLYVEPQEVSEQGNRLSLAEAEVEREVARVLAKLSAAVALLPDAVARALDACLEADVLAAIANWAAEARATVPELIDEARFELVAMRHPLLVEPGRHVVANDLVLRAGSALVISGPNAGGKTVALKCLGLAAWMARAGFPLPADPSSRIGWFDPVLTDVGDDQSLVQSLSTFSGHVRQLCAILQHARPGALVLLDEVAAGTDPEEGSVLAAAVIERLVDGGAAVAVTTHYERLKELAASSDRIENASVGFDLDTLTPTFELALGTPGASSALAVAGRLGMPEDVVARAEALLPEPSRERERLLEQLAADRRAAEAARQVAERQAAEQSELTENLEREQQRMRERERARVVAQVRELEADLVRARSEIAQARRRMREEKLDRTGLREVEDAVSRAAAPATLSGALAVRQIAGHAARAPAVAEADLEPGRAVRLSRLGLNAEVLERPARGQVRVRAGSLKLSVPLGDLELAGSPPRKPAPRKPAADRRAALRMLGTHVPVRTRENTLDLRGLRVEEALERIDAFLDRLLSAGEPAGYVLHGHGTGALKAAVREHLTLSKLVDRARPAGPEDGGDAFTVLWLAD